ncbi:MAG TPA: hypothetical protein VEW25_13065 [Allosphingosinicella sp.]|nr:hypothetical protein [Allosphingosinicella sp.]
MNLELEQEIRARAGNLALAWHNEQRGEFRGSDVDEYSALVAAAHVAADESRLALHRWVDAGRRAGLSWADIGRLIGTSKQAAQQRFGGGQERGTGLDGAQDDSLIVRNGATALNELRILEEEGRAGRELIGTGLLTLAFRPTDTCWEYQRIVSPFAATARGPMEKDGWTYVSSWYPFHYFKREIPER